MADVIKSDIEKIERALNIRVEDVEINVVLNAAFPPNVSTLIDTEVFKDKSQSNYNDLMQDFIDQTRRQTTDKRSSLFTLATAFNLCYQRNLFQLSKHLQSNEILEKYATSSIQMSNEILPTQVFELYTDYVASRLPTQTASIQTILRSMQREEKARLSSNEVVGKLIEEVARSIRNSKQHELTRRIEILQSSTREPTIVQEELRTAKKMLEDLLAISDRELIRKSDENIDWTNIAETMMNNQYTEKCCRHAWHQLCLPILHGRSESWSREEDDLLLQLVDKYGPHADQWSLIASNLPPRSPYMCANRYMFLDNSRSDKIKFQNDQIIELKQSIDECRQGHYVPLNRVAYKLGRSSAAVRREWRNVDPYVRRGQWQVDEDEALLQSVMKQANRSTINWYLISCDVSGRTQNKCYHRFIHLTRKTTKAEFDPADDRLLIEQHQLKNARWSQIQVLFPGRSCYTLQNRWRKLMQYRQLNELFNLQPSTVQSFILQQFPAKQLADLSLNDMYHAPKFQLTLDQLQRLTSNVLFIQLCNEIESDVVFKVSIKQLLDKLSFYSDVQQLKAWIFSKKISRQRK